MQYVLLIHEDEALFESYDEKTATEVMSGYVRFGEILEKGDHDRGGERLRPTATATTVRVRDDEVILSDGPFAETKEQLGGFYIVEAADLDAAVALAAQIPGAATGCVEVRPVWPMDE